MKKDFRFANKILKICGYVSLLCPILICIVLIFNFNIFALLVAITLFIFIIILNYYYHVNRIEVYNDRIEYYGFKKKVFFIDNIKLINVDEHGYIKLLYDEKKYMFVGYISMFYKMPNEEKNKELVEYINMQIKKNYRWY